MTNSLRDLLDKHAKQKFATDSGTLMHAKLQRVIIDTDTERGDTDLIKKIKQSEEISIFFNKHARTEVPIAIHHNDQILNRRIDRMLVDDAAKSVRFLDYKTDINKDLFRDKYIYQIKEYAMILQNIYPDYSVSGFILWSNDWKLEKIT